MAQIKWTNVNDSGANQALSMYLNAGDRQIGRVQDLLNLGAEALGSIESNRVKAEEQARKANSDYVINQMNNAQSLEELDALRRNGYSDANYLNRAFGVNGINLGDINQAAKTWQQDTVKRAEANDLNKDFSSQGQASIQAIQAAIASGDYTKAQKLIADNRGNISNATFNDLTAMANKGYEADRKYTAEFYPLISQKEAQIASIDSALRTMDSKDPQFAAVQQQRNQAIAELQKLRSISGLGNVDVSSTNVGNVASEAQGATNQVQTSNSSSTIQNSPTAQSSGYKFDLANPLGAINTALDIGPEYEAQTNNDKLGYNLNNDIDNAVNQRALDIDSALEDVYAANKRGNEELGAEARGVGMELGNVKDIESANKAYINFQASKDKLVGEMTNASGKLSTDEVNAARAKYAGMKKLASTLGLDDPNLTDADKSKSILNYAKQKQSNDSIAKDAIREKFLGKNGMTSTILDAVTGEGEDIKLNDLYSKAPKLTDSEDSWRTLGAYLKDEKTGWSTGTKKQVDELLKSAKEAGLSPQETLKYFTYKTNERDVNNWFTTDNGDLYEANKELARNAKHIKSMKEAYKKLSDDYASNKGDFDFAQAADMKEQFKSNDFKPVSLIQRIKDKKSLTDEEKARAAKVNQKINEAMTALDSIADMDELVGSGGILLNKEGLTDEKKAKLAKRFGGMKFSQREYQDYLKGIATLPEEERKKVPTLYEFNAKLRALGFDPIKIEKPKSK